jgi:hypothetical protein
VRVGNELDADFDGAAVSVLARAVDVVGVDGEGFEIDVSVEVEVGEAVQESGDAAAENKQALVFEVAHDFGIAEGLCGVKAEFAITGSAFGWERIDGAGSAIVEGLRKGRAGDE